MPEIQVTQKDQGRTIEASEGDLIVVRLEENLTTGYSWEVEALDSPVIELLDSEYAQDSGELLGRGGMRTIRFQVKSPGSQHIRCGYKRPRDKAVEHFDVRIDVR